MTKIDNILALADEHASQWDNGRENSHIAREALRTALTEALAKDASIIKEGNKAQPVREPLQDALAWELWLNAVDTANNTGRLVAYTYKAAIERAHNIRGDK